MDRKVFSELKKWKENNRREALLIKGARQVGKTYIVEKFLASEFKVYIKIDFYEHPEFKDIFDEDLSSESLISKIEIFIPGFKMVPYDTAIFFDEIQFCPNARTSLKYLAMDERIRVIASGSLLGVDYADVRSYPVGYEKQITMYPLDFEEFLWALGISKDALDFMKRSIHEKIPLGKAIIDTMNSYFRHYLVIGGMPEVVVRYVLTKDFDQVREVQNKIVDGYRNDVGKYSAPNDRNRIFAAFDSIPVQLSQENKKFMYSRVKYAGPATNGKYVSSIQWLVDAGVSLKCFNLTDPSLPLEFHKHVKSFKLYFNDTGLLLSMLSGDPVHPILTGDVRVNKGAVFENAVACALNASGIPLYYFSCKNFEIDFIMEMRGAVAAIEVKSGNNKKSKSLNSMKEKYGTGRRIKLENTDIEMTDDGVEHYPLFCCAFMNDLYDRYKPRSVVPDPSVVNRMLSVGRRVLRYRT